MILVLDNYDSFTWNLVQALATLGAEVIVRRNDEASVAALAALRPTHFLASPGPGAPEAAGVTLEALAHFAGRIPTLGVCLGHQALAQAFGGRVVPARQLVHGKTTPIYHRGESVFAGLGSPFRAMRYHSLAVDRASLPTTFQVSAWTDDEEIMGLRHTPTGAIGVQFHPESILTPDGPALLQEFLRC